MAAVLPTLDHERQWWQCGIEFVAGVDEVGRGALAGPLVAAAVVLPRSIRPARCGLTKLCDSKLLTPAQRETLAGAIGRVARSVGVGWVAAIEIDTLGLSAANRIAMERAVAALAVEPAALLLDAVTVDLGLPQCGLIDGDARCLSVAAASVIAKVARDRWMSEFEDTGARYGFAEHKGYGTERHLNALKTHGPCAIHRRSFAPVSALCGEHQ